jgi:hypothetical protein
MTFDHIVATVTLNNSVVTMTLDTTVASDTIVAFVILVVTLLMPVTAMWYKALHLEF